MSYPKLFHPLQPTFYKQYYSSIFKWPNLNGNLAFSSVILKTTIFGSHSISNQNNILYYCIYIYIDLRKDICRVTFSTSAIELWFVVGNCIRQLFLILFNDFVVVGWQRLLLKFLKLVEKLVEKHFAVFAAKLINIY